MAGIAQMATTYNCPNFVGELFSVSPEDTPLLSAIGGLTGGESVNSPIFTWQSDDLRDGADDRQRVEGADAPTPDTRVRAAGSNVLEIHQEQVSVTYTKQAATGLLRPVDATTAVTGVQPVQDELAYQLNATFKAIARDVDKSFLTGQYALPTDNASARKTRGLIQAITTNAVDASSGALTETLILDLMQKVWESGGISESETRTIITGAKYKRALTKIFITDKNYQEGTRNVGGVNLKTIETDFGSCNIMLSRNMPAGTLVVASLDHLSPAFMEIPNKGHFFAEPLAKTGARESYQVYGEIGLKYGSEKAHGKLVNLG